MALSPQNSVIGFIGTGVMGRSMAGHLLNAGYKVAVYTRTKAKAEALLERGAEWCDTVPELAERANVIITMVGFPQDVREIYLGENGLLQHAAPETYVVDMTTSSPALAVEIYEQAKQKRIYAMDAPVSGGDRGAREAMLAIMAGGDEATFAALQPILKCMGKNIVLQGKAGAGQYTKMSNQIAIASGMIGVCEAIVYAERAGLDPTAVLKSIESGAAGSWSLSHLAPRMIAGDFAPGFYVKHFIKDMKIALDSAAEMGLELPGLALARELYEKIAQMGEADSGTQALYKWFAQQESADIR